MSTILEALKKLEHDKAKRKPGQPELDLDFLDSKPPAPRRSPLKGLLMVGLLLACGGAATYLFMTRAEKTPTPALPAAPQARQVVLKPATSAHLSPPPLTNRSSVTSPGAAPPPPLQVGQPAPAPLAAKPPLAATKAQPESPPTPAPVAKQRAAQAPKSQLRSTPLPSLTVNGIALSDGEKRKAIVNGMSVSVGSTVEGARVEDILEHRVRFSYGGKTFEISVGSTGP